MAEVIAAEDRFERNRLTDAARSSWCQVSGCWTQTRPLKTGRNLFCDRCRPMVEPDTRLAIDDHVQMLRCGAHDPGPSVIPMDLVLVRILAASLQLLAREASREVYAERSRRWKEHEAFGRTDGLDDEPVRASRR